MKSLSITLVTLSMAMSLFASTAVAIAECNPVGGGVDVNDAIWKLTNHAGSISPSELLADFGLSLEFFTVSPVSTASELTYIATTTDSAIKELKFITRAEPVEWGPRQTITITFGNNISISSKELVQRSWTYHQPQYRLAHVLELPPSAGTIKPIQNGDSFQRQIEGALTYIDIGLGCVSTIDVSRFYARK